MAFSLITMKSKKTGQGFMLTVLCPCTPADQEGNSVTREVF